MNDKVFGTERGFAVKTLFISSLAKETRGDHLYDYFSTIGNVYSVRIHTLESNSFGFVTFKEAESAAKALKIKLHTVAGQKIGVEIADNCHQDEPLINEDLPIELTNATGTQLLDLNDDCLQEILSNVGIMDLCSLTETSTRLKAMANEAVSRKHRICDLMKCNDYDEARRVLSQFGSRILELTYSGFVEYDDDYVIVCPQRVKIIELIIRYCNDTLKTFNISGHKLNECFTVSTAFKMLFKKLQRIRIFQTYDLYIQEKDWFANCEVVDLFIAGVYSGLNAILQNTFTNLQHFYCSNIGGCIKFNQKNFFSRHKNLRSIGLFSLAEHSSSLPTIAANCKNLEKLQIYTHGDHNPSKYKKYVKSIAKLQNLKELLIYQDSNATKFIEALESLKSLQQLELRHVGGGSDFLPALLRLKNITILRLYQCLKFKYLNLLCKLHQLKELLIQDWHYSVSDDDKKITFDLVHMIKNLTNLRKLSLRIDFSLDEDTYLNVVDVVRERRGQLSLEIECKLKVQMQCYRNYCHLVKLRQFQDKNRNWCPQDF